MNAVNRLSRALMTCALFLTVLVAWRETFSGSCAALSLPAILGAAIFYASFQEHRERRRFAVDYYLNDASGLRRWTGGAVLSTARSLCTTLPLAALLAIFAALSGPAEWYILGGATIATPILFAAFSAWAGSHFRRGKPRTPRTPGTPDILTARLAAGAALIAGTTAYVYASYGWPVPDGIHPDSAALTMSAFAARAASVCEPVNAALSSAARLEGLAWWSATTAATSNELAGTMKNLLWAVFFVKAAGALSALTQGLKGCILLVCGRRNETGDRR